MNPILKLVFIDAAMERTTPFHIFGNRLMFLTVNSDGRLLLIDPVYHVVAYAEDTWNIVTSDPDNVWVQAKWMNKALRLPVVQLGLPFNDDAYAAIHSPEEHGLSTTRVSVIPYGTNNPKIIISTLIVFQNPVDEATMRKILIESGYTLSKDNTDVNEGDIHPLWCAENKIWRYRYAKK